VAYPIPTISTPAASLMDVHDTPKSEVTEFAAEPASSEVAVVRPVLKQIRDACQYLRALDQCKGSSG